ncbi:ABC transporter, ATP-binding protein [Candidatus Sulfotelmatobacter sp. SbA7]|jgi:ABC-2 type transport system ATP-binding protein|nr:ABC transporter, ATP-binding protein [Candidatus Sulfotelmatobacter sp. SbA7]
MLATMPEIQERRDVEFLRPQGVVAQLQGVSKTFGEVHALRSVEFSVRSGELLALLGPNGAGKTTAVKLFLGLARPTAGTVNVLGGNPVRAEVRTRIGAMLQVAKVPETLKVREHIDLFSSYYPRPLPQAEALAIAGLQEIKDRPFGELSGGQKQRVLFALALCGDPDILFLDEPTVGLDVEARRLLWEEIRKLIERGKTVLLTTHYLEEADALADRVAVINRGEIIAEGTPSEIKAKTCGRRIRCVSRLDMETLRAFPGVVEVRKDRDAYDIRVAEAEPVLRELLMRDSSVSGIEVVGAGLEEAFLALTQNGNGSSQPQTSGRQ